MQESVDLAVAGEREHNDAREVTDVATSRDDQTVEGSHAFVLPQLGLLDLIANHRQTAGRALFARVDARLRPQLVLQEPHLLGVERALEILTADPHILGTPRLLFLCHLVLDVESSPTLRPAHALIVNRAQVDFVPKLLDVDFAHIVRRQRV